MENKHTKIKKRFLYEIYTDIIKGFFALLAIIIVPLMLSIIFTPELIKDNGYLCGWFFWAMGTIMSIGFIAGTSSLIKEWIGSRWEKATREENGR